MGSVYENKLFKSKCLILLSIDEYCLHYLLTILYIVQLGL